MLTKVKDCEKFATGTNFLRLAKCFRILLLKFNSNLFTYVEGYEFHVCLYFAE